MNTKNENEQKQTNGYPTENEIQDLIRSGKWKEIGSHISEKKCGFFGNDISDKERDFYRTLMLELINSENIPKENLPKDLKQVISSLLTERNREAFLNFTYSSGNNLFHLCILKGKKEIFSLLLEKNGDNGALIKSLLFGENKKRSTPIELAIRDPSIQQLIRKFIQNKYDLMGRMFGIGRYFEEALFKAVENNNQKITEIFLDAGVNAHRCNGKGQSLLDIAEEKEYRKIAGMLKEKVKNASFEGFKGGAIKTAEWTIRCTVWGVIAITICAMIAALPLLIKFAPGIASVFALTSFFAPESLLMLPVIPFIFGVPIGIVIGGILSLVTAPIGGIINGARIVFNKKMHENQKRREASTAPLVVEKQSDQPSFSSSASPRCNMQPAASSTVKKSWFSFWFKPSDKIAPPAEDAARVLSHSHF